MLSSGVKLAPAIVAIGLAILVIFRHFAIGGGTGTVIATLAAGTGWLIFSAGPRRHAIVTTVTYARI